MAWLTFTICSWTVGAAFGQEPPVDAAPASPPVDAAPASPSVDAAPAPPPVPTLDAAPEIPLTPPADAAPAMGLEPSASAAPAMAQDTPAPSVILTLAEPSPVIGLTGETALSIEVENPPASPMPMPRLLCSAGHVEDLSREGPAKFTARYILPTSRYPQPAILVAEFADSRWPLRGMAPVRLRAAATPMFRTDPGAQVTLRVADRDFGPQAAGPDGMVHIPVVVPPGVEFAVARSVNQHGKSTEQVIDLHVPYSQRVLIAAPETLSAGSLGEVAVYVVDTAGRPGNAADLVLRAGHNRVHPLGSQIPGEARFLVSMPNVLRRRQLRIEAQIKGLGTTLIATRIALVPGEAVGLSLEPEAPHLERKPSSSMRVFLGAEDAFGNPVDTSRADVLIDGAPAVVKTGPDGERMVAVQAPAGDRDEVLVEGVLDAAYAVRRIPLQALAKPAPAVPVRHIAYPRYTLTPRVGVLTNFGALAGATLFVDGFVHPSVHDRGLGLGVAVGLIQGRLTVESAGGITRADLSTIPVSFQVRQDVVWDRVFAGVGAGVGFAMADVRLHSYNTTVVGRSFGAMAEASVEAGILLRRSHVVLALHYLGLYLSDFTTGDHLASNAGGAVLDLGYRRVW